MKKMPSRLLSHLIVMICQIYYVMPLVECATSQGSGLSLSLFLAERPHSLKFPAEIASPEKVIEFTKCDSCPARAKKIATFLTGDLFFCNHHAKKFEPKFVSYVIQLKDIEDGAQYL